MSGSMGLPEPGSVLMSITPIFCRRLWGCPGCGLPSWVMCLLYSHPDLSDRDMWTQAAPDCHDWVSDQATSEIWCWDLFSCYYMAHVNLVSNHVLKKEGLLSWSLYSWESWLSHLGKTVLHLSTCGGELVSLLAWEEWSQWSRLTNSSAIKTEFWVGTSQNLPHLWPARALEGTNTVE